MGFSSPSAFGSPPPIWKSPSDTRTISTPLPSVISDKGALAVIVTTSVGVWVSVGASSVVGVGESMPVIGGKELGISVEVEITSVDACEETGVSVGAEANKAGRNLVAAYPFARIVIRAPP